MVANENLRDGDDDLGDREPEVTMCDLKSQHKFSLATSPNDIPYCGMLKESFLGHG